MQESLFEIKITPSTWKKQGFNVKPQSLYLFKLCETSCHSSRENLNYFCKNKVLREYFFIGAPILYSPYWDMYMERKVTDLPIIIVDQDRTEMSAKKQSKCLTTMKLLPLIQYYTTKIIFLTLPSKS
jgi:hypothetical protein